MDSSCLIKMIAQNESSTGLVTQRRKLLLDQDSEQLRKILNSQDFQQLRNKLGMKFQKLTKMIQLKFLDQGEALFFIGDSSPKYFYLVLEGRLNLLEPDSEQKALEYTRRLRARYWAPGIRYDLTHPLFNYSDGSPIYTAKKLLVPGTAFGELLLIYDEKRTMTVVAKSKAVVGYITKANYLVLFKQSILAERKRLDSLFLHYFPLNKRLRLKQLNFKLKQKKYRYGDCLYHIGDEIDGVFLIMNGEVALSDQSLSKNGYLVQLVKVCENQVIGLQEILERRTQRYRVYQAKVTSAILTVMFLPMEHLRRIFHEMPKFISKLAHHYRHHLSKLQRSRARLGLVFSTSVDKTIRPEYQAAISKVQGMVNRLKSIRDTELEAMSSLPIFEKIGKKTDRTARQIFSKFNLYTTRSVINRW